MIHIQQCDGHAWKNLNSAHRDKVKLLMIIVLLKIDSDLLKTEQVFMEAIVSGFVTRIK